MERHDCSYLLKRLERREFQQMLKAIFLLPRRRDLTHAQFVRYWANEHQPIVSAVPGCEKVSFSEAIAAPEGEPPYDAVVEMWFDDLDAVRRAILSPEAKRAEESLVNFVDYKRYKVFLTAERSDTDPEDDPPSTL